MWRRSEVVIAATATSSGGEGIPSSNTSDWTLMYLNRKSEPGVYESGIDVPGCRNQIMIGGRRT
jgi:hypothetical protein